MQNLLNIALCWPILNYILIYIIKILTGKRDRPAKQVRNNDTVNRQQSTLHQQVIPGTIQQQPLMTQRQMSTIGNQVLPGNPGVGQDWASKFTQFCL